MGPRKDDQTPRSGSPSAKRASCTANHSAMAACVEDLRVRDTRLASHGDIPSDDWPTVEHIRSEVVIDPGTALDLSLEVATSREIQFRLAAGECATCSTTTHHACPERRRPGERPSPGRRLLRESRRLRQPAGGAAPQGWGLPRPLTRQSSGIQRIAYAITISPSGQLTLRDGHSSRRIRTRRSRSSRPPPRHRRRGLYFPIVGEHGHGHAPEGAE